MGANMQNNQSGSEAADETRRAEANLNAVRQIQWKQIVKATHTDKSAAAALLPTIREER